MKKFIAGLAICSLAVAYAQTPPALDNVATGTFGGSVGGMCVVTSQGDAYTGNLAPVSTDTDGFATRLAGSGDFSFKSNAPCTANSSVTSVSGPSNVPLSGSCNTNGATSLSTPTVLAKNSDPVNATVNAELTRQNFFPLLAGQYTLVCTTTLTAGAN